MLHRVISKRKMSPSHKEAALGSTGVRAMGWGRSLTPWQQGRGCRGAAPRVAVASDALAPWCSDPEAPCRLRPSFPAAVGSGL